MKPKTRFAIIEMGLMFVVSLHIPTEHWWVNAVLIALVLVAWWKGYHIDGAELIEEYKKTAEEALQTANRANATSRQLLDLIDSATEKKE